jgi:hypothetical protein
MPWRDEYGLKDRSLVIGFDDNSMTPLERYYGFSLCFEGYTYLKPHWHDGLKHVLDTLAEKLGLEILPPKEKLEAPELTREECMAWTATQEKARAEQAEADEKAQKNKRRQWCQDNGIDIDLDAEIDRLDKNAILDSDEACLAAVRKELGFAPDEIIHNGKTQYFGDYTHGTGGAGWLRHHNNPQRPWASFGNRRKDGDKHIWKGDETNLTAEQLQAWEKRHAAELLIDEMERAEAWEQAAKKAREKFRVQTHNQ